MVMRRLALAAARALLALRANAHRAVSVVFDSKGDVYDVSVGGFAPNGDLWLLEFRMYDARVRNVGRVLNPSGR